MKKFILIILALQVFLHANIYRSEKVYMEKHQSIVNEAYKNRLARVDKLIHYIQDKKLISKLNLLNNAVNDMIKYRSDSFLYGKIDYIALPDQTIRMGQGDCEDYALLKWDLLKKAGCKKKMFLVKTRLKNSSHMVLAVVTKSKIYVLDNLYDELRPIIKYPLRIVLNPDQVVDYAKRRHQRYS